MANALSPMMPRPDQMAMPSSNLRTPEYLSPTAPAPAPAAPRAMPNALSAPNAYMGAPKKPQNEMLGAAVRGFQRGFDPEGFEQQRSQAKVDGQDKAKQTLALMQQQRQLPEEQRTQWWQQNAGTIGGIIGQDISQQQVDPAQFSDQALDGQIAALSGQLGIAPATPEPMSAYQAEQIRLEQEKAGRPQGVNLGDGAYAQYNPETGQLEMLRDAPLKEDPANYDTVTMADGIWAVNKRNPSDKVRIGAAPPKATGGSNSRFRPATQQEASRYGAQAGQIDEVSGRFYPSGGQNAGEYSATERKQFRDKSAAINTLNYLIEDYRKSVDDYGPQLMDSESDGGLGFRKTDRSQQLLAKHNNLMMFLKGPELFNLGVLTGPDVERLQRTLPEPVGPGTVGQNKDTLAAGLNSLNDFVGYKMSLIPEQFRDAKPAADGKRAQGAAGAVAAGSAMSGLRNQIMRAGQQDDGQDDDMDGLIDGLFGDQGQEDDDVSDLLDKYK